MRQVFLYILIIGSCDGAYSSEGYPPITESPSSRGNSGVKARQPFRWQTFDQKHAIKSKNCLFYTLEVTCRGSVFSRCQLFSALWNGMMAVLSRWCNHVHANLTWKTKFWPKREFQNHLSGVGKKSKIENVGNSGIICSFSVNTLKVTICVIQQQVVLFSESCTPWQSLH